MEAKDEVQEGLQGYRRLLEALLANEQGGGEPMDRIPEVVEEVTQAWSLAQHREVLCFLLGQWLGSLDTLLEGEGTQAMLKALVEQLSLFQMALDLDLPEVGGSL